MRYWKCLTWVAVCGFAGIVLHGGEPEPATAQIVPGGSAPAVAAPARDALPRTLDADGLEQLFQRVATQGGVARLPGGTYRINRTVRLEGMGPIRIEGEGFGDVFNPAGTGFKSQPTRLLWTGEPGGTMFELAGSIGQEFSNVLFDGDGRAGVLIQFSSKPGWGTGFQRFTRVAFRGAEVGLRFGKSDGDFNCADVVYDEVCFVSCGAGLQVLNHQSVNHHFRSLNAHHVGTVLDFQRGGNVNVEGWAAGTFDRLLNVGYGGVNASSFRFVAGRPEMNGYTKRYATLAAAAKVDNCDIVFESTQETGGPYNEKLPDNSAEPVFTIGEGAALTVRNHYHIRPFLQNDGGVYRDIDSRWHISPTDEGASRVSAGQVEVTAPRDVRGRRLEAFRRDK